MLLQWANKPSYREISPCLRGNCAHKREFLSRKFLPTRLHYLYKNGYRNGFMTIELPILILLEFCFRGGATFQNGDEILRRILPHLFSLSYTCLYLYSSHGAVRRPLCSVPFLIRRTSAYQTSHR